MSHPADQARPPIPAWQDSCVVMVIQSVAMAILGVRPRRHTINRQRTFTAPGTHARPAGP
ncbi:hypothetical protein E1286_09525 [Nonomuraea terrae]|uniref:Uncharacterized protein n=1 Tax=Nonomuraea terrae TaxID=2530383 RepID=A0A4V2YMW2_9ACTN|nr:hypothetical protein [Nonomuraea terrae]TDD52057.1 hypothetical protein E1286_09525 [Nonomuraea terrae]